MRVFAIGSMGAVRMRWDADRLRNIFGVVVQGRSKGFATWNEGSIKPERQPPEYQGDMRKFAPPQRQPRFKNSGDASR